MRPRPATPGRRSTSATLVLLLGAACASGEGEGSSFGGLSTASASSPAGTAVDTGSTANLTEAPDPTDDPGTTTTAADPAITTTAADATISLTTIILSVY